MRMRIKGRGWRGGVQALDRDTVGMKTPPEMIDDNSTAHSRPAFHTDLSHTYNDDDVSQGAPLPLC